MPSIVHRKSLTATCALRTPLPRYIYRRLVARSSLGDVRRRWQYNQSRRIKGFIRFLPARARRYLTFPSPTAGAICLSQIVLKVYPCVLHSHKLPNKNTLIYQIGKINLHI